MFRSFLTLPVAFLVAMPFLHSSETPIANAPIVSQVNALVTDSTTYYLDQPTGAANGLFGWNGPAKTQEIWTVGSGLTVASGVISVSSTAGSRTFSTATPTLNSASRLSTISDVQVSYPVDIGVTSILLATTQGTASLQYADDSGFTTNVVTVVSGTQSVGGVASITNTGTVTLAGIIKANKYRRILTTNTAGSPTFTARQGQEVTLP